MNKCSFEIIKTIVSDLMCQTPTCEIGSCVYDKRYNLRTIFAGEFVGIDMRDGPGVDMVYDIHDLSVIKQFKTAICTSMLEHDNNPLKTIASIKGLIGDEGIGIFTIPFNMHIHNYPSDYWRMTPEGLSVILKTKFSKVVTFPLGGKFFPHSVVGIVNSEVSNDTIQKLKNRWPSENGWIYYLAKCILPPFIIHTIKYVMHGRFY
jgi:hypothetical protein